MKHLAQEPTPVPTTEVPRFKTRPPKKVGCSWVLQALPGATSAGSDLPPGEVLFLNGWLCFLLNSDVRADAGPCFASYPYIPGYPDQPCFLPQGPH